MYYVLPCSSQILRCITYHTILFIHILARKQLQIETTHKRATSFESLPVFQRSRVDVAQDGGFTIRKRNPELDIKTDYVPIYLSDSVTNLSVCSLATCTGVFMATYWQDQVIQICYVSLWDTEISGHG